MQEIFKNQYWYLVLLKNVTSISTTKYWIFWNSVFSLTGTPVGRYVGVPVDRPEFGPGRHVLE